MLGRPDNVLLIRAASGTRTVESDTPVRGVAVVQAPVAEGGVQGYTVHADGSLVARGPEGEVVERMDVPVSGDFDAVATDRPGQVWLSAGGEIVLFDMEGESLARSVEFDADVAVYADGAGGVWAVARHRVVRLDELGSRQADIDLLGEGQVAAVRAAAVNAEDQSLWFLAGEDLSRADAGGALAGGWRVDNDDLEGAAVEALLVYADTHAPRLRFQEPSERAWTNERAPRVLLVWTNVGRPVEPDTLVLEVNGERVAIDECDPRPAEDGSIDGAIVCSLSDLEEGEHGLQATVEDRAGNASEVAQAQLHVDTTAPQIALASDLDGTYTNEDAITVAGEISESADVTVAGTRVATDIDHAFEHAVGLEEDGAHAIAIVASDRAGNTTTERVTVYRDTQAPEPAAGDAIDVHTDAGEATITGEAGSVEAGAQVRLTNTDTGTTLTTTADDEGTFTLTAPGDATDTFELVLADAAGNVSAAIEVGGDTADANDPAAQAPAPEPGVATTVAERERFLFEGNNPIQRNADAEVFEDRRLSVVRGRVTDADGEALVGVTVRILGHPEYGYTETRADGEYDLAVNGGGRLTVDFDLDDHLPVQRPVDVSWQDYVYTDEIALIELSDKVTTIDLTEPGTQVARGPVEEDADGPRQATVLFPEGTTATITDAEGNEVVLDEISFRATEYTVGSRGPQMMPGELPPSIAYTYAVELSVDEALEAGAATVDFDQRVPLYVENFLDFPTGTGVPVGYYDRERGQWIGYDNGAVIEILAIEDGKAVVDVTGDGPATEAQMDALHMDDAERARIAGLYDVGDTLQRVALEHFSPWDLNYPIDTTDEVLDKLPGPEDIEFPDVPDDEETECSGCIIHPESQTLAKELPVQGTPLTLRYDTKRQDGHLPNRRIEIPVTGEEVHEDVTRVEVTVTVAGQRVERTFEPEPNQTWTFVWDGRDIRGRALTEPAPARIEVEHIYPQWYRVPPGWETHRLWGAPPEGIEVNERNRFELGETQARRQWTKPLRPGNSTTVQDSASMGGWTLDRHRAYIGRALLPDQVEYGDGPTLQVGGTAPVLQTVFADAAGAIAMNPDGSFFVRGDHRVTKVDTDGTATVVAGTGTAGFSGDGGPATEAELNRPAGLAVGPDGALYIADSENDRIRRVATDGIITTIAGTGERDFGGDGGPAIAADLDRPWDIAFGDEGAMYIADAWNRRIRRVGADGTINTVAGTGSSRSSGDGGLAVDAGLGWPGYLTIGPDGAIFIASASTHDIRRVGVDGIIETVAGTGRRGFDGDGGLATQARLNRPRRMEVTAEGTLYFADGNNRRIRRVDTFGIIETIAGGGEDGTLADGQVALDAPTSSTGNIALTPEGAIYFSNAGRTWEIAIPGMATIDGKRFVPSKDGSVVYIFDRRGQHQATLDTITGTEIWQFDYDEANRLISITDVDGDETVIERNADGMATAIISPDGHETALSVNADGRLAAITDPTGATWSMAYNEGGLLTALTDRKGAETVYGYNDSGEIVSDVNAEGGGWTIASTFEDRARETVMETAEGRTHRFRVESLPEGGRLHTNTGPGGLETLRQRDPDTGSTRIEAPDGTERTFIEGPDPRFGMQSPVAQEQMTTLPSGRARTRAVSRTATLDDDNDPLSLRELSESITTNGRTRTRTYSAAAGQWQETSPAGRSTTIDLDDAGRMTARAVDGLAPLAVDYDERGRPETVVHGQGEQARETAFAYHEAGQGGGYLATITDPMGRTVDFEQDGAGRVTKQTLADGRSIRYDYDPEGNLRALTPPGRSAHLFEYDGLDQRTEYDPPALDEGRTITRYRYNLDQQLTEIERPDGETVTFDYNAGGRVATRTTAADSVDYHYDAGTGRLDHLETAEATITYDYDGFLLTAKEWTGAVAGRIEWTYDDNFWLTEEAVADQTITFDHDADGLLTGAGDLSIERDTANGLIAGTSLAEITGSRSYNAFGEPASRTITAGGETRFDVTYERDALGRITELAETTAGASLTEAYTYDEAGRLTEVREGGVLVHRYDYDDNGNRLRHTGPAGTVEGDYDEQDRLIRYGDTHYDYTDAGELKEKSAPEGITRYDYDAAGNLREVELPDGRDLAYLIDGRDRRIGKKIDGEIEKGWFYRDQLNPVAQTDGEGHITHRFVYAEQAHAPSYMIKTDPETGEETTYRLVTDHLGSIRLVIDAETGEIAQRIDYDPFGNVTTDTSPGFQPFGFAGGLHDRDTGLVRFGARDYDPETGRWTAKDPIDFLGGDTNLYGYVLNDPVNWIDPFGLETLRCSRGLGGPNESPTAPSGSPFRHDYLVVDGEVFSFQAGDNMYWSQGFIDDNEQSSNEFCETVSDDPLFDDAVRQSIDEIGAPMYNLWAYPGTSSHMLGARNCQTWIDDVLNRASGM